LDLLLFGWVLQRLLQLSTDFEGVAASANQLQANTQIHGQ
jgi:hypothetical protein